MQHQEGQGEESAAEQVPERGQVGDGAVIRVDVAGPEEEHEDAADVEQQRHLRDGRRQVGREEGEGGRGVSRLHRRDGRREHEVAGHHQQQQQPRRVGVRVRVGGGAVAECAARAHAAGHAAPPPVGEGVEVGGHARGLHRHQVAAHPVHDGLEHGDTVEGVHGVLEDEAAARAEQHGEDDGGPAVQQRIAGAGVAPGHVEGDRGEQEVAGDEERRQPRLLRHVRPQLVRDPGEEGEGGQVAQRGRDGRGHVVRVDPAAAGAEDDGHHDEAEHEAGHGGRDHGAGAHQQPVLEVDGPVLDVSERHAGEAGQEADDDGLALDEGEVPHHERRAVRPGVHLAEVGGGGEAAGERHLEVPLEAEQRGHHDDHADLGEDRPVLHHVEHEPGGHHAQPRDDEGGEDLRNVN